MGGRRRTCCISIWADGKVHNRVKLDLLRVAILNQEAKTGIARGKISRLSKDRHQERSGLPREAENLVIVITCIWRRQSCKAQTYGDKQYCKGSRLNRSSSQS